MRKYAICIIFICTFVPKIMNRSITLILLFAFFVLGSIQVDKMLRIESQNDSKETRVEMNGTTVGESTSFISGITDRVSNHNKVYDCMDTSEHNFSSILFSRNDLMGNGNLLKLFKTHVSIRNVHTQSSLLAHEEYKWCDMPGQFIRPTNRYYVYALRHILI